VIDTVYPLDEAREAFARMKKGAQFSTIVLDLRGSQLADRFMVACTGVGRRMDRSG
jgi:hypothetical protein